VAHEKVLLDGRMRISQLYIYSVEYCQLLDVIAVEPLDARKSSLDERHQELLTV
jgi:hypothetical protein